VFFLHAKATESKTIADNANILMFFLMFFISSIPESIHQVLNNQTKFIECTKIDNDSEFQDYAVIYFVCFADYLTILRIQKGGNDNFK
jgi:hypothetical protein